MIMTFSARPANFVSRLGRDRSGLALLEFAFTLPLLIAMGGYGTEISYFGLTNLRVSQYALNLADNASRVGIDAGAGVTSLRETDINDVLQGARLEGKSLDLGTNARVILSSLEFTKQSYDTAYTQRIHWQRCFGMKSGTDYDSHYGTTTVTDGTTNTQANDGTTKPSGIGDPLVNAPKNTGVMYVEINYSYRPVFSSLFVAPQIIHYTASLMVRDNRDLTQIYNPNPAATRSTCDKYIT